MAPSFQGGADAEHGTDNLVRTELAQGFGVGGVDDGGVGKQRRFMGLGPESGLSITLALGWMVSTFVAVVSGVIAFFRWAGGKD